MQERRELPRPISLGCREGALPVLLRLERHAGRDAPEDRDLPRGGRPLGERQGAREPLGVVRTVWIADVQPELDGGKFPVIRNGYRVRVIGSPGRSPSADECAFTPTPSGSRAP